MKLGTLTTGVGVVTEFSLPYFPAAIHWTSTTALTGLRINSLGDGTIVDLDATGLTIVGSNGKIGATSTDRLIPLSNGLISGKNTLISFTNSAAQTPDIFIFSMVHKGNFYVKNNIQKVYAGSGIEITDFSMLFLPAMAATDELNVTYRDGLTQKLTREDLRAIVALSQDVNLSVNDYFINNISQSIRKVSFIPTADQNIYLQKYAKVASL